MGFDRARGGLIWRAAVAALAVITTGLSATAGYAACVPDQAELRWPGGKARFAVDIADTPDKRAKGLMFVESMPKSSGMLFVYDKPQRASFWMKNTLIPLDMIFADASGTVRHVHAMAKPQDTTSIKGGDGVQFVLEINGGLAARLGIEPGAELRHPSVDQSLAAWPCEE